MSEREKGKKSVLWHGWKGIRCVESFLDICEKRQFVFFFEVTVSHFDFLEGVSLEGVP